MCLDLKIALTPSTILADYCRLLQIALNKSLVRSLGSVAVKTAYIKRKHIQGRYNNLVSINILKEKKSIDRKTLIDSCQDKVAGKEEGKGKRGKQDFKGE